MRLHLSLILFSLFAFCTTQTVVPTSASSRVALEEYAVYSSLIKKLYIQDVPKDDQVDLLIIQELTSLQDRVLKDLDDNFQNWKRDSPSLSKETLDDLKSRNEESQLLSPLFDIPLRYSVVSKAELKSSFSSKNPDEAWKQFYKKYPNSSGLVSFSRVGFNPEMNQALVYVERSCGMICAYGRVSFLRKINNSWIVEKIYVMWVT